MTSSRSATLSTRFRAAWLLLPLAALAVLAWSARSRVERYGQLSALPEWSVGAPGIATASPTGHTHGERSLFLHDPTGQTFAWIIAVQQQLAGQSTATLTFDNAPFGRPSALPAAYRATLVAMARAHQAVSTAPAGTAADWVALHAGTLLFALLIVTSSVIAALTLGPAAGGLIGVAWLALYPIAETFAPNLLTATQLAYVADTLALLLLVGVATKAADSTLPLRGRAVGALAGAAGFATGVGLATDPALTLPLAIALGVAGAGASLPPRWRWTQPLGSWAWRAWSGTGTITFLLLATLQPGMTEAIAGGSLGIATLALAWLALGEWLTPYPVPASGARRSVTRMLRPALAGTVLVGSVIAWVWRAPTSPFSTDLDAFTLFPGPDAPSAARFGAWFARDGFSTPLVAVLMPALGLVGLAVLGVVRRSRVDRPGASGFTAVAGLVLLPLACVRLRYWGLVDFTAIVAFVAALRVPPPATEAASSSARSAPPARAPLRIAVVAATLLTMLVPGLASVRWTPPSRGTTFTRPELQTLIARDLAHWIHRRNADAIVLASPALTGPLVYYGGMRGIITFDPANKAGFESASRIFQATTAEEAHRLIQARQITHLVFTSWDGVSGTSSGAPAGGRRTFLDQVLAGDLPPWLRPLPYFLLELPGFTRGDIMVLEVVPPMERPTQLAALAAYFLETGQTAAAHGMGAELARYPTDLNALVTRFEIAAAAHDADARSLLAQLADAVGGGADADLTPDVRARVALALAHDPKQAGVRETFQSALADFTTADVLALTPRTLLRVLATAHGYSLTISDPAVRAFALSLLPPASRRLVAE